MMARRLLVLITIAASWLAGTSARAQEAEREAPHAHAYATQTPGDAGVTKHEGYRSTLLWLDVGILAMFAASSHVESLAMVALPVYVAAPPVVHGAHHRGAGVMFGSLGLRIALPIAAARIGYDNRRSCPDDNTNCNSSIMGASLLVGLAAAMLLDDLWLAGPYETRVHRPAMAPTVFARAGVAPVSQGMAAVIYGAF